FETKFNLNEWINAGVPTTVSLYASEKDMNDGKNVVAKGKFIPAKKASDITTVVFEEMNDESFEIKVTVNDVDFDVKVTGAIAYKDDPKGIIWCQAKPNTEITVTFTSSDGSPFMTSDSKDPLSVPSGTTKSFKTWSEATDEYYMIFGLNSHVNVHMPLVVNMFIWIVDDYTEQNLKNIKASWSGMHVD
ncbi:MAG: hypothetical protein J5796_03850, partial [Erysipelotrichaceae bacterium]|nr:hypothetical protein [Erysipelotrichaceae bacterium]